MSNIKKFVEDRTNELALLEQQKEEEVLKQPELVTTTVRLYEDTLHMLDTVSAKLELRRSDVIRHFLEASAREALMTLKVDPVEWYGGAKDE